MEWLGEVPGHWTVTRLKSVASINMGQSPSSDDCTKEEVGLPFLQGNADFGEHSPLPRSYCAVANKLAKVSDILFSVRAPVGAINIADQSYGIGRGLCAITPSSECSMRFIFHALQVMKSELFAVATGSTYEAVSIDQVGNATCLAPPRPEQIQIAAFLDRETAKIDELMAEQRRLMELLKEKRSAVISHAVTKGMNPNAPMKPSCIEWLGEVPEHWMVIALKRIADVQTGVAKGKDNKFRTTTTVPYLRVANVQDGYLDLESVATIEIPVEDLARYSLKPGDVLMNEGGDFDKLGRGHVWDGQIDPCITQNHVFAVRPHKVSSVWLNAITGSDFAQFYFMTRSKQSTNLASISSTNLMELPVILPPVDEQLAILSFIGNQTARFDTLTTETQRAITLLQERRTALISAAVTGQIDVRQQ